MSDAVPRVPEEDLRTQPKRPEASLGELASELTSELSDLLHKEVELAKVEARHEAKTLGSAVATMAVAGVAAVLFLAFASVALVLLLDEAMPRGLAVLIVAAIWAVIAAVLVSVGRKRMAAVEPLPETTQTLKEDVQWTKTLKH